MKTHNLNRFLLNAQTQKDQKMGRNLLGRKNILDLNILVCVDRSSSISESQRVQFFCQIDKIRGLSRIKVLETDSEVSAFYDYFKVNHSRVVRIGRGDATEFSKAFSFAKKLKPDVILFLTDSQVAEGSVVKDPGIPVGWILTSTAHYPPYSFGEVIVQLPPV